MISSWTCSSVDASTTSCVVTASSTPFGASSSAPLYTRELTWAVPFGIAIIVTILFVMVVAMIFNSVVTKRPWQ